MWQWVMSDVSRQSSCVFELTDLKTQDIKGKQHTASNKARDDDDDQDQDSDDQDRDHDINT